MNEIENSVAARIHAGYEIRPGDRALRWQTCLQPAVVARNAQPLECRQLALGHHGLQQIWIHAIETKDDHLQPGAPSSRTGMTDGEQPVRAAPAPAASPVS